MSRLTDLALIGGVLIIVATAVASIVRHLADWNLRPTDPVLVGPPVVTDLPLDVNYCIEAALDGLAGTFEDLASPYVDDEIAATVRRVHFDLLDGGVS